MAIIGSSILELEYSQINSPSIVGELATGLTVTIEVWKEGVIVSLVSNVCVEIGSIGQYSCCLAFYWSCLENILALLGAGDLAKAERLV